MRPASAQGDGNAQPGQVVGKTGKDGQGKGDGQAGDRPGVDYYETDVTLEELIEIMFEDLELPNLERRALREIPVRPFDQAQGLPPRRHPRAARQAAHRAPARDADARRDAASESASTRCEAAERRRARSRH